MIEQDQIEQLIGNEVVDRNRRKIGNVGQIYYNTVNGRAEFAAVNLGLFGLNRSLVPIVGAELRGDEIVVPYDKHIVKEAPNVDAKLDEPLSPAEVQRLYDYYGFASDTDPTDPTAGTVDPTAGR